MDYYCKTCEECGLRYHPERDISWKHHHFCGHKCLLDFKEDNPALVNEPDWQALYGSVAVGGKEYLPPDAEQVGTQH
jgi:hypothetical protein